MCSVHERNDKKLMIKTSTLTVGKDTGARVRKGDGHQHVILWLDERSLHFHPIKLVLYDVVKCMLRPALVV